MGRYTKIWSSGYNIYSWDSAEWGKSFWMDLMVTGKLLQSKRAWEREKTGDIWRLKWPSNFWNCWGKFNYNEAEFHAKWMNVSIRMFIGYVDPVIASRVLDQEKWLLIITQNFR